MKQIGIKGCVLLLSVALISCSSNTQNENTGIGAVTGGVLGGLAGSAIGSGTGQAVAIGTGIVAGALIGGYIGHQMQSSDNSHVSTAMGDNPTNQATRWRNPKTNMAYTVTPTSDIISYRNYQTCRRFTATANGHQTNGIMCRQANGTWKQV